jgi:hypothetical protein
MLISTLETTSRERPAYPVELRQERPLQEQGRPAARRYTLDQLLKRTGPLPPYTALLGLCADGRPYLFDLRNPKPGSILISGGGLCGKTALLKTVLASAALLNPADKVRFGVLSARPEEWDDFLTGRHCLGVLPAEAEAAAPLIEDLANLCLRRMAPPAARPEPVLLLAIDDLHALQRSQPAEVMDNLAWLAENGPESGIWVLATRCAGQRPAEPRNSFRTRIFGQNAQEPGLPEETFDIPDLELGQFALPTARGWLRFWSPMSDNITTTSRAKAVEILPGGVA